MSTTTSERVAQRYARAKTAAVVVRNLGGVDWGWYSGEERSIYLVPVNFRHFGLAEVVLEDPSGRRRAWVTRNNGDVDAQAVIEWLGEGSNRADVENIWVSYLVAKGWLTIDQHTRELVIHPGHDLERRVSLTSLRAPVFYRIGLDELTLSMNYRLRSLIWS